MSDRLEIIRAGALAEAIGHESRPEFTGGPAAYARLSTEEKQKQREAQLESDYKRALVEAIDTNNIQLAENYRIALFKCLVNQGKLYEAANYAGFDEGSLAEVAMLIAAIELDDNDRCDCPDDYFHTVRRIWSDKHGEFVGVHVCPTCNHTNAHNQPLSDQMTKIEEHRADVAMQIRAGVNPKAVSATNDKGLGLG